MVFGLSGESGGEFGNAAHAFDGTAEDFQSVEHFRAAGEQVLEVQTEGAPRSATGERRPGGRLVGRVAPRLEQGGQFGGSQRHEVDRENTGAHGGEQQLGA